MSKMKILTVDDDPDILDVLDLTLSEHFDVIQAPNGKAGLEKARTEHPDLIITDYMMPEMLGPEFCKELRKDILLSHIPIIMLTGKGDTKDMVGGIESGADDYLVKPFDPDTLMARIKMILTRTERNLDANPLTHLPGNASIMEEIQSRIQNTEQTFAVGYTDLDKFKIYNDHYGFEKGDEVIKMTARILVNAAQSFSDPNIFIGHIGGDDFVFICPDEIADEVSKKIIELFDEGVPSLYAQGDLQAGFIVGTDRQGNELKVPIMTISIGIVSSATYPINHVAEIGEIGAELKKLAKSEEKSNFVRDRRQREPQDKP